ncbi:MAG: S-layer protein [Clostridia bacterium]|nr:S-layer protein [Clostridia bacterium]
MRKITKRVLSCLVIFAMILSIENIGWISEVNAESTTSAVQQIVVAAVTMNDAAARTVLADNITNTTSDGSHPYTIDQRRKAITDAFIGVSSYLLQPGYVDAVITKMDAQSQTSKDLIRQIIIEGAPASINYNRTGFQGTTLYNDLNDMITGGHSNDNGIKFLIKLFQSTAEVYNGPVALDAGSNIRFEITGFHQVLADALFSDLMKSFETLNNMITNKAGTYATYTELLSYSADLVNASGCQAEFKRLLIANSATGHPIYSGSVTLLPDGNGSTPPSNPPSGGGVVLPPTDTTTPTPTLPDTIPDGTVTTTTNPDGGITATVAVEEQAVKEDINNAELENVTIDVTALKDSVEVTAEISGTILETIADSGKGIEIKSGDAVLLIPEDVIKQISEIGSNESFTITISEAKPEPTEAGMDIVGSTLDFGMKIGDEAITNFNTSIQAQMQVDMSKVKDYRKVIASYYNEEKQWEPINGYLDKETGVLVFYTDHFSKFAAIEYSKKFDDVNTQWAIDSIEVLAARNIMNGKSENRFDPKANITRAEVAVLITRVLHLDAKAAAGKFSDVPTNKWYAEEVEAAAQAGIIDGVGGGKFAPEAQITREQIAVMICRALEYKQGKTSAAPALTFTDAADISEYAKNAVAIASSENIVKGSGSRFNPKDKATREQVAVMIYRLLEAMGEI